MVNTNSARCEMRRLMHAHVHAHVVGTSCVLEKFTLPYLTLVAQSIFGFCLFDGLEDISPMTFLNSISRIQRHQMVSTLEGRSGGLLAATAISSVSRLASMRASQKIAG